MMMSLVSSGRDPESCPGVRSGQRLDPDPQACFFPLHFHTCSVQALLSKPTPILESPRPDRQPGGPGHGQATGHSVSCMLV